MANLEKILRTWKHMITHEKGGLSKGMLELIIETIKCLEELEAIKHSKDEQRK